MDTDKLRTITAKINEELTRTFEPEEAHKRAKSAFWGAVASQEQVTPSQTPDLSLALRLGGNTALSSWWAIPGFPEWFWNRNEFTQRLDFVAMEAIDQLERTLRTQSITQDKKIPAIRIALELSGKLGKQPGEVPIEDKVAQMDRKQLEHYINTKINKLTTTSESDIVVPDEKN